MKLQSQNMPKTKSSNSWIRSTCGRNTTVNAIAKHIPRMIPSNLWENRIAAESNAEVAISEAATTPNGPIGMSNHSQVPSVANITNTTRPAC